MQGRFVTRQSAIDGVQVVEAHARHVFPKHFHDTFGIGSIVAGAQRSWSGRGFVEAGPGHLITCNPGEVHDGAPIGEYRQWKMLYLSPSLVASIATDIREGQSAEFEFLDPVIDRRDYARVFETTYRAVIDEASECADEHLICLIAALLQRRPGQSKALPNALCKAKAAIDDDPTAPITLDDIALGVGMSRFQVLRAFVKLTGLTPHAYILQKRLEFARAMIAKGSSLADCSAASGFADQSHFNRNFVRRYGLTPGAYASAVR